jgi:hypothetical protein
MKNEEKSEIDVSFLCTATGGKTGEGKANDLFVQSSVNSSCFSPSTEIRIIHKSFRDHRKMGGERKKSQS